MLSLRTILHKNTVVNITYMIKKKKQKTLNDIGTLKRDAGKDGSSKI